MNLNQLQVIGTIADNIEIRDLPSWTKVTDVAIMSKFSVETSNWWNIELTSYTKTTFWWNLAERLKEYTKPWFQVFVSWRLKTDSWDWEDWTKRYSTKLIADNLEILSKPGSDKVPEWFNELTQWLNQAEILWNIVNDIVLRETQNGTKVASFTVATNRRWRWADWEFKEDAEFHNIVLWWDLAEKVSKIAKKWQKIYISWYFVTRSWDWNDWKKRYTSEIIWQNVRVLWYLSWENNTSESFSSDEISDKKDDIKIPEVEYATDVDPNEIPF